MEAIPQREVLTTAELRLMLEALNPTDLNRLQKEATFLAPGTGMEPKDLLQEAVMRSLEENGGRTCPRDVRPVTFLCNVMKSIASHSREKWKREMPSNSSEDEEGDPILKAPDPAPSPEEAVIRHLHGKKVLARILAIFDEDLEAQAIVIGIMEDWTPREIREMESMSEKNYAAARKRVRRKLPREFPKGLTHE